jgi:hypothetical protein
MGMIRIAIAAALAAIVITDVAFVPASTGLPETIERPRGLKGDRLPVLAPDARCDAPRFDGERECIGVRRQPAEQTPAMRHVLTVVRTAAAERTLADGSPPNANAQRS